MRTVSIRSRSGFALSNCPLLRDNAKPKWRIAAYGWFVVIAGCGESQQAAVPTKSRPASAPAAPQIEVVDAAELPIVDAPPPPLDEGRLELSLPGDWRRAPRSKEYLIKVQRSRQANYPTLTVTVEPAEGLEDLTGKNAVEFAARVQAKLDAELKPQGLALAEAVRPVEIGDLTAVEYVRRAKSTAGSFERLFIVTVAGGRQYTLELRAVQDSLAEFRPWARAVAASMKFSAATADAPTEPQAP